jgi:hypothetical protein
VAGPPPPHVARPTWSQSQEPGISNDQRYWFRAKRYGWGWGVPCAWQGWVVLLLWLAVLTVGTRFLLPHRPLAYLGFTLVTVGALLVVSYKKGEPPAWRWGDRQ